MRTLLLASAGDVTLEFAKDGAKLPDGWTLRGKEWKVAEGELKGQDDGALL